MKYRLTYQLVPVFAAATLAVSLVGRGGVPLPAEPSHPAPAPRQSAYPAPQVDPAAPPLEAAPTF